LSPADCASPQGRELLESTRELVGKYAEARHFISALAKGRVEIEAPRRNQFIAPYKNLHAALRHLLWQIRQVADGNYNLRIDFLGDFSASFNRLVASLAEKQRLESSLSYQHHFQKMIAEISTDFLAAPHAQLDTKINRMLQRTGEFFAADRAYLFQFSADGQYMENTHEWCAAGVAAQIERMRNVAVDTYPWWARQIRNNENVHIPDVDLLPPEAAAEKAEFQLQGIQTILCVPITGETGLIGLFGFDSVHGRRDWEDNEISFFRVAANTVANALQKYRLEQELIRISISDSLTGLFNRRYLHTCLPPLIAEYRRTQKPFAVAFFDIDHFKSFNDTHGHLAGDFILEQFGHMLKEGIRPFDIACRFGGEEFLLLVKDADLAKARGIAERVLQRARTRTLAFEGRTLSFTLSCGIADCGELGDENLAAEALIAKADRRLYLAKRGGRDRCVCHDDGS